MNNFTRQFEELDLALHGVRLPSFEIEKKYKRQIGVSEDISNEDFLEALCENGKEKMWSSVHKKHKSEYAQRLEHELRTIKDLGFIDYLLLVWDVINFCKESDIPTGLGRGSAAGSLVLYLIGVTKVDPLEHGLFFERFISKIIAAIPTKNAQRKQYQYSDPLALPVKSNYFLKQVPTASFQPKGV